MIRSTMRLALFTVFIVGCSQNNEDATEANNSKSEIVTETIQEQLPALEQDLQYFSELFEGEYSNIGKVVKSSEPVQQAHYVYRNVDLPAFGNHVVYVQQYYGSGVNPATVYRQRIYSSYADTARNEIVTRIYSFSAEEAPLVVDAQYDASKLQDFTPENMSTLPQGCEIFWYREGENIVGYQKEGLCTMNIPNTEIKMQLSDELLLTPALFSTFTIGKDMDGNKMFGDDAPSSKYRASIYHCTANGSGTEGQTIRTHDMGGELTLASGDRLRLRKKADSSLILEMLSVSNEVINFSTTNASETNFELGDTTVNCALAENPWQLL